MSDTYHMHLQEGWWYFPMDLIKAIAKSLQGAWASFVVRVSAVAETVAVQGSLMPMCTTTTSALPQNCAK